MENGLKEDVMEVRRYTFQSPYPSPVQFGRLDPSSVKSDDASQKNSSLDVSSQTQQKAQMLQNELKGDVKPMVEQSSGLLDLYA